MYKLDNGDRQVPKEMLERILKERTSRKNERDSNYYKLMDSLTDEQLALVRIGQLKVVVKDTVRSLVKPTQL